MSSQSPPVAPLPRGPGRLWVFVVAVILFGGGAVVASLCAPSSSIRNSEEACRLKLRAIYVVSRHLPLKERRSYKAILHALGTAFMVTEREHEYLFPKAPEHTMTTVGPWPTAIVCRLDPDYGRKIGFIDALKSPFDVESSYRCFPDEHTIAACPFHRIVLMTDGSIESE